jgi:hypothetical protein
MRGGVMARGVSLVVSVVLALVVGFAVMIVANLPNGLYFAVTGENPGARFGGVNVGLLLNILLILLVAWWFFRWFRTRGMRLPSSWGDTLRSERFRTKALIIVGIVVVAMPILWIFGEPA